MAFFLALHSGAITNIDAISDSNVHISEHNLVMPGPEVIKLFSYSTQLIT